MKIPEIYPILHAEQIVRNILNWKSLSILQTILQIDKQNYQTWSIESTHEC